MANKICLKLLHNSCILFLLSPWLPHCGIVPHLKEVFRTTFSDRLMTSSVDALVYASIHIQY